ncbi:hypothetical protein G6L28_15795 [Agrobacterium larrymoorei]|uniref:hypothetical protein n=1 Tax=Agrobacterium larrymoorei TaxID=160699 RepID=UPI001571A556|nr:hypothetical protein [Agrobacterium larrymoorei]NTJ44064.1 hypothetical protein [Agrobacterium larrymoorei]
MKALLLSLMLLPCCWQAAHARDFTAAEKAGLGQQIQRFDAALTKSDFKAVSDTIPPKVLQAIASKAGISLEQLRAALTTQMQIALASVKLLEFDMDFDKAQYHEAPDGTPYVLVPTRTLMETEGTKLEAISHTLALVDSGEWYLLRVSDAQQVDILREVYPSFADVELPAGTVQPVQ